MGATAKTQSKKSNSAARLTASFEYLGAQNAKI
jgi:hypothetical protein